MLPPPPPPASANSLHVELYRTLRTFGLFAYYLAILILLLWIYGRGDTPTAPFVYQGF